MDYNKEEKDTKKTLWVSIIAMLILLVAIFSVSFATITFTEKGSESNTLHTGEIRMSYTEDTNGISIENALPISDDIGMKLSAPNEYFDFTVSTTIRGNVNVQYEISAEKDINSTLKDSDVKLYLEKKTGNTYEPVMSPTEFTPLEKTTSYGTEKGSMLLTTGTSNKTESTSYRLRMWIRQAAVLEESGQTYTVRVNVKGGILS